MAAPQRALHGGDPDVPDDRPVLVVGLRRRVGQPRLGLPAPAVRGLAPRRHDRPHRAPGAVRGRRPSGCCSDSSARGGLRPAGRSAPGLGALATWGFWSPRPQVLTYLLLAMFVRDPRRLPGRAADRLCWLPVLTARVGELPRRVHGGPGAHRPVRGRRARRAGRSARHRAGRRPRRARALALWSAASVVASLANPFHYKAVLFPFQVMRDRFPGRRSSSGRRRASSTARSGWSRLVLAHAGPPGRVPAPAPCHADAVVLAAFFHFGLQAIRNVPLLVVVSSPILARAVASSEPAPTGSRAAGSRPPARWPPGLTVWPSRRPPGGGLAPAGPGHRRLSGRRSAWPTSSRRRRRLSCRGGPPGPLFNDYGWGGYLIWQLYPELRVGIDGRMAVYGPAGSPST